MTGAVEATRGCPYHCEFCPETNIPKGNVYFKRPVTEAIEEIRKIPQKTLMIYDASLTTDPSYKKELFNAMKGLRKRFFCNGNADVLAKDENLVRLSIGEAGCIAWLIGFESLNQDTLDSVGKKTNTVSDYTQAIRNIQKNNMAVIGDFIFGFDTDTPAVFEQTLNAMKKMKIDVADLAGPAAEMPAIPNRGLLFSSGRRALRSPPSAGTRRPGCGRRTDCRSVPRSARTCSA